MVLRAFLRTDFASIFAEKNVFAELFLESFCEMVAFAERMHLNELQVSMVFGMERFCRNVLIVKCFGIFTDRQFQLMHGSLMDISSLRFEALT